jgi:cellulose synthase/poly-beta-1,6-N-acetylglucosamine synthase-like glycosyltransferase
MILSLLLVLFAALYCLEALIIWHGSGKLHYTRSDVLPQVSILVALRNEEETVAACIESLLAQDFPQDRFEIILINDRSSDRTGELIQAYAGGHARIKILDLGARLAGLSGKASAIAQGMQIAGGELIMITDGDSTVPKTWLRSHASYYDADVGMVGGFTLLDRKADKTSLFGRIQSLDWLYLLTVGSGAIGVGKPLSVLGNNLSFRKQAYEQAGGYETMGFTIIEDFALMRHLLLKTDWQVRYPVDTEMLVVSKPMPRIRPFYQQRKRWSAGGREVGIYGKFLMFVAFSVHLLLLLSLRIDAGVATACMATIIMMADFLLLYRSGSRIHRLDLLKYFVFWEFFYFFYTILFAPALLFPTTVNWKHVTYSWQLNWKLKKVDEKT